MLQHGAYGSSRCKRHCHQPSHLAKVMHLRRQVFIVEEDRKMPARPATALRSSNASSGTPAPTQAPATSEPTVSVQAEEEEERKLPAITPEKEQQVQEDIKAYIERWREATPSERCCELQVQGQAMLEQMEALKKIPRVCTANI